MYFDENELRELIEESEDTHSDAMRKSGPLFDEFVELGLDQRARGEIDPDEGQEFAAAQRDALRHGLIGVGATAGIGAAILALSASAAGAATASDVQILQTNQSIENLAIATYTISAS